MDRGKRKLDNMRNRLKNAFQQHESFHGDDECSVVVLSYTRDGAWHATDTGPDTHEVDTVQVIQCLSELIAELASGQTETSH